MKQSHPIVESDHYQPTSEREKPVVINTHMFQDSFQALPGQVNGVGGSATVHAHQALGLGSQGVMVAPASDLRGDAAYNSCKLPSVAYGFVGNSPTNHDEWYEDEHRAFLLNDVMNRITGREDIVYAHMPISGQIAMEHCRSNNNPLIYLGHAWETLSSTFFPDRAIKPLRLTTEYALIDYLASAPGRGCIVTNSRWEADAIAKAYSKQPSLENIRKYMVDTAGCYSEQPALASSLEQTQRAINYQGIRIRDYETIRSLCIPNPIGVDIDDYHPKVRERRRSFVREQLLQSHDIPANAKIVGGVGRIHPQKDPLSSLDVFHRVWIQLGRPDDTYLLLAGPGDKNSQNERIGYYAEVVEQLNDRYHEIRNFVRIPGEKVDAKDINSLLDVRLCTARFETWGLSFQESLCMGVPSVALTNPVYDELYQDTGIVVTNNRNNLADSIVTLLRDSFKRTEYGKHCWSIGARFDWNNSVRSLKDILKSQFQFE